MRFFNHLLNEPIFQIRGSCGKLAVTPWGKAEVFKEQIRLFPKIIVDNVAEYGKRMIRGDVLPDREAFPLCVPPFEFSWIEYKYPLAPDKSKVGVPIYLGYVVTRSPITKDGYSFKTHQFARNLNYELGIYNRLDLGCTIYYCNPQGEILARDFLVDESTKPIVEPMGTANLNSDPIILQSISMMNCKNVNLTEPDESKKLADKRERKSKPAFRYHVLKVTPMSNSHRTENIYQPRSEPYQSLHICRGHFKDYRDKGLFGKYKGIYWWDSHLRGDMSMGIVDKDYELVNNN